MSRGERRQRVRRARRLIAAPHHMHVGPQQKEIAAVDVARARAGKIENLQRRAARGEGLLQRPGIGLRAAEAEQVGDLPGAGQGLNTG